MDIVPCLQIFWSHSLSNKSQFTSYVKLANNLITGIHSFKHWYIENIFYIPWFQVSKTIRILKFGLSKTRQYFCSNFSKILKNSFTYGTMELLMWRNSFYISILPPVNVCWYEIPTASNFYKVPNLQANKIGLKVNI